jgi:hypothetical protein
VARQAYPASMGTRLLSLPMRPPSRPPWLGILVAAALIAAETLVVYPRSGADHRAVRP